MLAGDGKIYGIPYNSDSVLIIDPASGSTDTSTLTGLSTSAAKWDGGVLATNGKIYAIPYQSAAVRTCLQLCLVRTQYSSDHELACILRCW